MQISMKFKFSQQNADIFKSLTKGEKIKSKTLWFFLTCIYCRIISQPSLRVELVELSMSRPCPT